MSDIIEFGFDDGKVIQNTAIEAWKQQRIGEVSRISVVSFKTVFDCYILQKMKEGKTFTDDEKREIIKKIDVKLAESLKKPVDQLTQTDRLDIKQPKFGFSYVHPYKEGIGTIRCLSQWEGKTLKKPDICCEKLEAAEQVAAMIIMTYPIDRENQIDEDLLLQKKYTNFFVWKMKAKKFQDFDGAYKDAHKEGRHIIDLKVTLGGAKPEYQLQTIVPSGNASWAQEKMVTGGIRDWALDQGIRAWKHVPDHLGFKMSRDKLVERLAGGGGSSSSSSNAQMGSGNNAPAPALTAVNYDELAG